MFNDYFQELAQRNIHIIVQVPVAGKCLPMIYQGQSVLKCVANSESEESVCYVTSYCISCLYFLIMQNINKKRELHI